MKILFLDDNKHRHRAVTGHMTFDAVFTASECIYKLEKNKYDFVFLDHDLNDQEMVNSFTEEETGYTVAKWISENKPEIGLIIVHSLNPAGSENMASLLKASGYFVTKIPFLSLVSSISEILKWEKPID